MITYSGLSGRRPKARRSRAGWPRSSGRPSDWTSTTPRPSSRMPAASGHGSSATTSASGTATPDHQRPQGGQRDDRAARAARRGHGPVRPLPEARQAVAPVTAPEPRRLRHRPEIRSRIRRRRQLLPARPRRMAVRRLRWNALTSMLKTLSAKHDSTVTKIAARHKAKAETRDGPRTCFEARKHRKGKPDLVARFGGITLRQDRRAVIRDPAPAPAPYPRKELIMRLRKRECELCETGTTVAVHQVTSLKDLGKPGPGQPAWASLMARMRRKTLIVCASCHDWIHATPVAHAA